MFKHKRNNGFLQLSLRADDVNKLRELKELGIIPSMSSWLHFLITKEIQNMKKHGVIKKRLNLEDTALTPSEDWDYELLQYLNKLRYEVYSNDR